MEIKDKRIIIDLIENDIDSLNLYETDLYLNTSFPRGIPMIRNAIGGKAVLYTPKRGYISLICIC